VGIDDKIMCNDERCTQTQAFGIGVIRPLGIWARLTPSQRRLALPGVSGLCEYLKSFTQNIIALEYSFSSIIPHKPLN
jgi:hypothetical protein